MSGAGRCVVLASLMFAVTAVTAAADPTPPTAKDLVARNLEARGGSRWNDVRTVELRGTFDAWSAPVEMTIERQRPARYRFDHQVFGAPATYACDGATAWIQAAAFDAASPTRLEESWKRNLIEDAAFINRLQQLAGSGAPAEVLGRDEVDGTPAWKIRFSPAGAPPETWYLAADTGLELKRESTTFDVFSGAIEMPMETYYMDFREVEGLRFPFREERHFGTRYHLYVVTAVRLNPPIDPSRFDAPPKE